MKSKEKKEEENKEKLLTPTSPNESRVHLRVVLFYSLKKYFHVRR